MYGPKCLFLLMYESHDMRHTVFPRVDGLLTDPQDLGRHIYCTGWVLDRASCTKETLFDFVKLWIPVNGT